MAFAGKDFYRDSSEHLAEELAWINHLIYQHINSMRKAEAYPKFEKFSGLYISDEEIESIINFPDFLKIPDPKSVGLSDSGSPSPAETLRKKIDRKVENSLLNNVYLPLSELKKRFALDDFEYRVFLICLAAQVDIRYPKLFAYLQNDLNKKNPGVSLILDLLCGNEAGRLAHLNYFHPEAELLRYRLLDIANEAPATITQQYLSADPRLVYFVLQNDMLDERVQQFLQVSAPLTWE